VTTLELVVFGLVLPLAVWAVASVPDNWRVRRRWQAVISAVCILSFLVVVLFLAGCGSTDSEKVDLVVENMELADERDDLRARLEALCARIDRRNVDEATVGWLARAHDEFC